MARRPNDLDGYEDHLADVAKAWIDLVQCAWRFEVRRQPGVPGPRYGFMSYLAGEAGHHDHEPVYRLADEESAHDGV